MEKILLGFLAVSLTAGAAMAQTALAPVNEGGVRRNAWEQIPAGFIGNWKLDLMASKYGTTAPRMQYRIFDYTADGKFLCTYITLGGKGGFASGNWAVQLDGTPGAEYTRAYGSTPFAIVTLKKVDENNLDLTAARFGKVFEAGTFTLSPDGETLTFSYHQGDKQDTAVYHRWDMLN
ncbi:MAG TPA: hypothetical protein VHC39_14150 [Rhizomicrobium sp.]|nr:hypothetical protein [Rhizomicrobium sp.]